MHTVLVVVFKFVLLVGNDPADEEVDIGGNEPPVSSYSHVEIEKDTTYGMNKSLSPGSSNGK